MTRFILPIILIGVSITAFLGFINPNYTTAKSLQAEVDTYNSALTNAKELQKARDSLNEKYTSFSESDLEKLKRLLPDNIDNIRLIIEIRGIANQYGMEIQDPKYDVLKKEAPIQGQATTETAASIAEKNKGYGSFDLSFSTSGTYNNFINFIKDVEKSLRVVDISSVTFSSETGGGLIPKSSDFYKYDIKVKTYYLKS
ncbi:MAG: hypothetical protein WDK96_02730 [Candidatus Paceibacterota bacterium]|jgi:Tfp pilus assembly protein PilO